MKILVLTSRYTATRDILDEDFGRQTRLLSELVKLGHKVDVLLADYKKFENKKKKHLGINFIVRPFTVFRSFSFFSELNRLLKKDYDVLISTSDPLWGITGLFFARSNKKKFVYDIHDNFETYSMYKIPFFKYLDRLAVKKSDEVIVITETLRKKLSKIRVKKIHVVRNGVDKNIFKPLDKKKCRKNLGLPLNKKIVVYTGSIQRYEGVDRLLKMFSKFRDKDIILVVAGRFVKGEEKHIDLKQKNVIYLGSVNQKTVAEVINSGDVAVIPYTNNNQVTYGFPYKLAEYMACEIPLVATSVGDVQQILKNKKKFLCSPNSFEDMRDKIQKNLKLKRQKYYSELKELTWAKLAKKLERIIS